LHEPELGAFRITAPCCTLEAGGFGVGLVKHLKSAR
jgi:hypothetical protein